MGEDMRKKISQRSSRNSYNPLDLHGTSEYDPSMYKISEFCRYAWLCYLKAILWFKKCMKMVCRNSEWVFNRSPKHLGNQGRPASISNQKRQKTSHHRRVHTKLKVIKLVPKYWSFNFHDFRWIENSTTVPYVMSSIYFDQHFHWTQIKSPVRARFFISTTTMTDTIHIIVYVTE